jgi:hypothetical protein
MIKSFTVSALMLTCSSSPRSGTPLPWSHYCRPLATHSLIHRPQGWHGKSAVHGTTTTCDVQYVLTFSYSTLQRLTTLFRCWGAWHGGAHPPAVAGRPCLAERTHLNRPRRRPPCPPTRLVQPRRLAQLARRPLPPPPTRPQRQATTSVH